MRLRAIFLTIVLAVLLPPALQPSASESNPLTSDEAPVCDVGGPYPCQSTIQFDGRRSYDPDGMIVSYKWDFGDGQTSTEAYVFHQYQAVGTYPVSLLVVDDSNLSSTCDITVEVHEPCKGNCPPVCDAGGPYSGITGEPILFDGTGSVSFTCLIFYVWDFGDGAAGVGPQPTHMFSTPGIYTITLTVTDSDGATSSCATTAEIINSSAVESATWGRIKHRRGE